MKTIIAGGRDQFIPDNAYPFLQTLGITEVVSGGATGIDMDGEEWARKNSIPVKIFKAQWATYGKAAGPLRNRQMAEYAEQLVLFPGGRGTQSMFNQSKKAGLIVHDWRERTF